MYLCKRTTLWTVPKPHDFIPRTVSAKIILQTVTSIAVLLAATILALTLGTRIIIREEVERQVSQALDGITYRLDNTLLGVEQTAAILEAQIPDSLGNPPGLFKLTRKALEANPNISGCAIALNPEHYTVQGKPFMAYTHKVRQNIVTSQTFTSTPFTEQLWYRNTLMTGVPSWNGALKNEDTETEPIITFDVPFFSDSTSAGVLGLDISLSVLTEIAQNYKTSTNSYITLLDKNGSFIVHPDSTKLLHMSSLAQLKGAENPVVMEALQSMVDGETGSRKFTLGSTPYYIAYAPFRLSAAPGRQVSPLGWSIAVIYPENDLFQEFDPYFVHTIMMIVAGILLLIAGGILVSRYSLKPLRKLAYVTRIISKGNYTLPGFETTRSDEVGRLQSQYNKMLHSVADHMEQLQSLSQKENAHQAALSETFARTKEIKKQREVFFGNMTHQMVDVTAKIQSSVDRLSGSDGNMEDNDRHQVLDNIERDGHRVAEILNDMLNAKD